MPFYKIKESFLEFVLENDYCTEIMQPGRVRGYFFLIAVRKKQFLIPLRTEKKHQYVYEIPDGKGCLDFTKSIPLITRKILDGPYAVKPKKDDSSCHNNINDIQSLFEAYYPKHNSIAYATDHKGLIKAQNDYK